MNNPNWNWTPLDKQLRVYPDDVAFQGSVDRVLAVEQGAYGEYAMSREEVEAGLWRWLEKSVDILVEDADFFALQGGSSMGTSFSRAWEDIREEVKPE